MGAAASSANPFPPNYAILEQKHHSGNISTYLVKDQKSENEMIMKMIFTKEYSEEEIERYKNGVINICHLELGNVVKSEFVPSNSDNLAIVMPKYSKSLKSVDPVTELNESSRLEIILKLCNSLKVMHENALIHGNIKPSNILISDKNDYYLSDYYENIFNKGIYNNDDINYKSIESIECKELDSSSDVWSIGCLIFYLHTGSAPFKGEDIFEIRNNIKMYLYDYQNEKINSNRHIKEILKKIFCRKEDRISISELIEKIKKISGNRVSIHSHGNDSDSDSDEDEKNGDNNDVRMVIPNNMGLDRRIRKKLNELVDNCRSDLKMEDVVYGDQRLKYLCQFFPQFQSLESLILNSDGLSDLSINDLSMKLDCIPHLKKLELSNNNISSEGITMISKKLNCISELCELKINNNKIKNDGMIKLSNSLSLVVNLTVLDISRNKINDDSLIELSNNLKFISNLKVFNCNENNISDQGFSYFSQHLKDISEIRNLEFNNNQINEISMEEFSKNMSHIKNLTELSLNNNKISDLGMKCLSENLMFITELKVLELSNNNINNIGIINFSNEMKYLCNLTNINLSNNNISDDDGFNVFCNNLNNLSKLVVLNVGYNKIGNAGLKSLSDNMKYLRDLVCLCLDGNEFTNEGLLLLCESFHYCDKLQYLYIRNSGISETTIGKIQSFKHLSVNYRL